MNPHTKTKQQTVSSFDRYCDKKSDFKSCPKATSFFRSMFEKFNYSEDNFDYVFDYFKNPDNLTKFNELIEPVKIQVSSIRSIILLQNINHDKLVTLQVVLQQLLLNVEKLETLKTLGIKFSNISCILSGTGNNAPKALGELLKAIDATKKY
ncbi:hypothetical protein OCHUTO_0286 [Orientia chuto str. Dubai]|uniref:Uncharacterized protein n=1 Tax=Orientia chuto str. Dubai TaxID=1359168 RepID=A0A0F3MQK2_9RICK|nr:hypothetical protein [Candidatus Orientia mediorientalis]KJV56879.1 hypothetical protein OCHUTO_0286 [Orientia chuto str. Dubai]